MLEEEVSRCSEGDVRRRRIAPPPTRRRRHRRRRWRVTGLKEAAAKAAADLARDQEAVAAAQRRETEAREAAEEAAAASAAVRASSASDRRSKERERDGAAGDRHQMCARARICISCLRARLLSRHSPPPTSPSPPTYRPTDSEREKHFPPRDSLRPAHPSAQSHRQRGRRARRRRTCGGPGVTGPRRGPVRRGRRRRRPRQTVAPPPFAMFVRRRRRSSARARGLRGRRHWRAPRRGAASSATEGAASRRRRRAVRGRRHVWASTRLQSQGFRRGADVAEEVVAARVGSRARVRVRPGVAAAPPSRGARAFELVAVPVGSGIVARARDAWSLTSLFLLEE